MGTWTGLGDLSKVQRLMDRAGLKRVPIACTEFSYLVSGRYKITADKTATYWPRAIKQASRWCSWLTVYGIGAVGDHGSWGSASLLDRFGRRLPGYLALARALGRVLPSEVLPTPLVETVAPAAPDGTGDLVPHQATNTQGEAEQVETPIEVPADPQDPIDVPDEDAPPVESAPETPVNDPATESGT